ncbi:hypothetical protein [Starkeya nomas]|uniref:hypothetical protein n=1 Tax=Starkeya nomas TaxID=2666134 RepID=UPI00135B12AA|nr:hypothetical protein [Starkeya nomas]
MANIREALSNLELALDEQSAVLAMVGRSNNPAECIEMIRKNEGSWQRMLAAHRKLIRLAKAEASSPSGS